MEDFRAARVFDCCREDFRDLWHFCEHRNIFSRRFRQKFSIVRAARGTPEIPVLITNGLASSRSAHEV